jgi:hypothetical protein
MACTAGGPFLSLEAIGLGAVGAGSCHLLHTFFFFPSRFFDCARKISRHASRAMVARVVIWGKMQDKFPDPVHCHAAHAALLPSVKTR